MYAPRDQNTEKEWRYGGEKKKKKLETRLVRRRVHVINEIHVEEAKNRDPTPRYRFLSLGVPRKFRDLRSYSLPNGARSNRD